MTFSAKALQNQYSVREIISFPERSIFFLQFGSGNWVVSRTEYLFKGEGFGLKAKGRETAYNKIVQKG